MNYPLPDAAWFCLRFSLLLIAYYVTGLIGLSIPFVETHITLIWAPSGIALAALLCWGLRFAPAVWLAAFAVNLSVDSSVPLAFGIACGNTLGPAVAAWLLGRMGFDPVMGRRRDLTLYLVLGVALGMLLTSSNGVFQLWLADVVTGQQVAAAWATWWLGDAMGVLVCGIPLLTVRPAQVSDLLSGSRGLELVTGVVLALIAGALIFLVDAGRESLFLPILYLPFFLLSWLAIRGGVGVASSAALLLSIEAVWATANGVGPFLSDNVHLSLAMLWGYMATATIITVLITVLVGELRVSERRLTLASVGAELGMWEWHLPTDTLSFARHALQLEGLGPMSSGRALKAVMHPADVEGFEREYEKHLGGSSELFEAECRIDNGRHAWVWVLIRGQVVECDSQGTPVKMAGTLIDNSERKRAEEALLQSQIQLRQSEERYRLLLSNSPVGILHFDRNLAVTYVNQRFAEIMQVPHDYMIGLDCHRLNDKRILPALQSAVGGERSNYEGRYVTSYAGVELWVSMACAPVTSESGDILGGIAMIEDITARKRIEADELRQREGLAALNEVAALSHLPLKEQLRKALQIGNRHFGLSFGIVSEVQNEVYRVMVQVSPADTLVDGQCFQLGDTYCDITLESEDVVAVSTMADSVHRHHPCYTLFQLEAYIGAPIRVAGQVYGTVNFSAPERYAREFDGGDREFMRLLARWIGSAIEHDQRRYALVASEERLKTIIENEPECVKVIAGDGEVLQMNRAGLNMLEVAGLDEVNRVGVTSFVVPEYREAFEDLNLRVLAGETGSLEFRLTGKRGHTRWLDTHAAPLRDADGKVTAVLSVTRDISLLKEHQQRLEYLAHYDGLTGLPNRTLLGDRMMQAVARARRKGSEFALCYLDLDGFKEVNDAKGHNTGDQVLKSISSRLLSVLRETDTVARLGGDEFVLLLSDIRNRQECEITIERILAEISQPVLIQGHPCLVSGSIGITLYPEDDNDPDTLLRHADQAMYAAKQGGKNRYSFYLPTAVTEA
ncbi:diguanylate cyclase [Marinobacterium sp. D7]|uniref:sensor domain-containing diguanylate cyclase n=1 Tax=Marinobacterium ramblicola TaxID=2849041 RepID=UPI001C2CDF0B|nr:sensor domain-containing diguanylate cyclase [Marinobacterium ramblicola]MBV1789815.1 diguanylate cyclase [Marinobacterium ramblicola]